MNFKEDLGGLAEKYKSYRLKIESPRLLDEVAYETWQEIGFIVKRTQAGRDKNNVRFTPYDKHYKKQKDTTGRIVRLEAKTRGSTVNLTMTGAMLQALKTKTKFENNTITAAIFVSPEEAGKALGHITGSGALPKRDFLGFSKQFIKKIKQVVKKAFTNG